jgi:hypothetical protein
VWLIDQSLGIELIKLQKIIGHASITTSLYNDQRSTHHFYISKLFINSRDIGKSEMLRWNISIPLNI